MFKLNTFSARKKRQYIKPMINFHKNNIVEPPKQIYSIIPLNIFQTWHTLDLPPKMKENVELLQRQNPEFKYYLYDDAMCRKFIKTNFDEEVVYSFDKLKPGAYKADLWRYCVLYIHGGIYLDIKYKCVNNFKLIELTDKEYLVKDKPMIINGIYQALMVQLPYNNLLLKAINTIVEYCKNDIYTSITPLCVTGPGLLSHLMRHDDFCKLDLSFNCIENSTEGVISKNNNIIMVGYSDYRKEQLAFQLHLHYAYLWHSVNIYNYPVLNSKNQYNYTNTIKKNILGKNITFFSGSPTIIEISNNLYLINIQWCNYNGKDAGTHQRIYLNSRFTINSDFNIVNEEMFLEENFEFGGLKDIKIFNHNDNHYYIANYNGKIISMVSNTYTITPDSYKLDRTPIVSNTKNINSCVFVKYNNKPCIVYNWFPLQIGEINYNTNRLNLIHIKYNNPEYFKYVQGSTNGYIKNNEIWFVLHKVDHSIPMDVNDINHIKSYNYKHFFAIFDLDMNLSRYSELFKLGDCMVEFCTGLIIKEDTIILSYSLLYTQSIISEYDINYIKNKIKWYNL
jgi:mannosyltransferase OCH1-like enzyme